MSQISQELFTALFILNSQFQFKPTVGKSYHLYQAELGFELSLISPAEWRRADKQQAYIGECCLQADLTWSLQLSESAAAEQMAEKLAVLREGFESQMQAADQVTDVLPQYDQRMPFHQRALAYGLAYSLKQSMVKSGIAQLTYAEATQRSER